MDSAQVLAVIDTLKAAAGRGFGSPAPLANNLMEAVGWILRSSLRS